MNILEQTEALKDLPDQALIKEMQMPTGMAAPIFITNELKRRQRIRDEFKRREAQDMPTVAEEVVTAAGVPQQGIMQMARNMAPKTNMGQNTGMADMMPKQPTMGMSDGGVVKMQPGGLTGGTMTAIAALKVNNPRLYEMYKDDPALPQIAMAAMEQAETPELTGLEEVETPRTTFEKIKDFANYSPLQARKNMEKIEEGAEERDLQARVDTANALRRRNQFYVGEDPIFNDGGFSEQLKGTVIPVPLGEDPLDFIPPNNMSGPSVAMDRPLNMANISQSELGPILPQVSSNRSVPEISSLQIPDVVQQGPDMSGVEADMAQDQLKKFIATEDPQFYGPEAKAMGQRAREFYNTDTFIPPELIYSGDPREIAKLQGASDKEIQDISDRLAKEAQADEVAKEQGFFTEQDNAAQSVFDEAIAKQAAMVEAEKEPKTASDKIIKAFQNEYRRIKNNKASAAFDAENEGVGSEPIDFAAIDEATKEKAAQTAAADAKKKAAEEVNKLIADSEKALATQTKTAGAAVGSVESKIADLMARREKSAEQDKWLAIAKTGVIMSSGDPKDLRRAGEVGIKSLQTSRAQKDKFDADMLGLQARIDAYKARIAAAGSKGALTTNQLLTQGLKFIEEGREAVFNAGDNADAVTRGQQLVDYGEALLRQAGLGGSSSGGAKSVNIS